MKRRSTILLYHPRTGHERNYRHYWTPYSVLSIAAVVDRDRYEVRVIDNNVEDRADFRDLLGELAPELLCVGISSMIGYQISDGMAFARMVRAAREDVPIVWGGPLPTVLPRETLMSPLVDFIVRGQGERPFAHLVDRLADGQPVDEVSGLGYTEHGNLTLGSQRRLDDINEFPPYPQELVDGRRYIHADEHIATRTMSYHSSQGCPFSCGFCAETTLWGSRWSALKATRVLHELEELVGSYQVNGIKFYDSEFFIDRHRVFEFARGLIDRGLRIRWAASVHPRNIARLTDEELGLLRDSGASRLLVGAESGVQDEIDLVGKRTSCEMILRIAERCAKFQIHVCFTFVTGYPTSPPAAIEQTLRFAEELRAVDDMHEIKVHFYAPYPGTPLWRMALEHGFEPPSTLEAWSRYDYYDIVTPWVDKSYEPVVRQFNETHYPYLHGS